MCLRTIQYLADQKLERRQIKRIKHEIPQLLAAIENHPKKETLSDDELFDVATIFINYLNVPDFLFKRISSRLDEIDIDKLHRKTLKRFVSTLLKRHEIKYSYSIYDTDDYDFNNKWTPNTLEVIKKILAKTRKGKAVSQHLIALSIISQRHLMLEILPDLTQRKSVIDSTLRQFLVLVNNNQIPLRAFDVCELLQIMAESSEELTQRVKLVSAERGYSIVMHYMKTSPNNPEVLMHLHYLTKALCLFKQQREGIPADVADSMLQNIKSVFIQQVLPNLLAKCQSLVLEVTYDKEIKQHFNPNVYLSDFAMTEFLPGILERLKVTLTATITSRLLPLFERTSRRWAFTLLYENMLFLMENKLCTPRLASNSLRNMLSLFEYYPTENKIVLNATFSDQQILNLLLHYISYFSSNPDAVQDPDTPVYIIGLLALKVFPLLTDNHIQVSFTDSESRSCPRHRQSKLHRHSTRPHHEQNI